MEFGRRATDEVIGAALKEMSPDVVCFNACPGGDWAERMERVMSLSHADVGKIRSDGHTDKT